MIAEPTTAQTVFGLLLAAIPIPILSVFLIIALSGARPAPLEDTPAYGDTTGYTGPEA